MDADALAVEPRTTGEVLDDAWRLALREYPFLLFYTTLFWVPAFAALLLLVTRTPSASFLIAGLVALTAVLLALTGIGSGACQDRLHRLARGRASRGPRADHPFVSLWAALKRGPEHVAARVLLLVGGVLGLGCIVLPGLILWMSGATVHALLARERTPGWRVLGELGREAISRPAGAAAVVLTRIPLLLLAVINLHLVVLALLWAADSFAGFETGLLALQLSPANPLYVLVLFQFAWVLLSPYHEAANFLLYTDTRIRQEGLDLLYRVRRALAGVMIAVGLLAGATAAQARQPEAPVRAVREGVEAVLAEVREAEPYPGGGHWEPRLRDLARQFRKVRAEPWFDQALSGFARADREGAIRRLEGLRDRLLLLEEALAPPRQEGPTRALPSTEEMKRRLPGSRAGPRKPIPPVKRTRPESSRQPEPEDRGEGDPADQGPSGRPAGPGVVPPAPGGGLGDLGGWILGGLTLAVLVAALFLFLASRRGSRPAARKKAPTESSDLPEEEPTPGEVAPDVLWRQADALARQGQFLEALRCLYQGVLSLLHRQRLLQYEPTRTNGEYLRQLRAALEGTRGDLLAAFEGLTREFEVRWYGDRSCTEAELARCRALAEEVRAGV
jgi:hypothetical protein